MSDKVFGRAHSTRVFVQTTGSPIRAAGIYTATYAGERVVVIEAQQQEAS